MTYFILIKVEAAEFKKAVYAAESLIDIAADWHPDLATAISLNVQPVEDQ